MNDNPTLSPDTTRSIGVHIIADLFGCDPARIDDCNVILGIMRSAAAACGATIVAEHAHRFNPIGITALAILAESHLSIHTWPEHAYVAVDVFTCGDRIQPHRAIGVIKRAVSSTTDNVVILRRGSFIPDSLRQFKVQ